MLSQTNSSEELTVGQLEARLKRIKDKSVKVRLIVVDMDIVELRMEGHLDYVKRGKGKDLKLYAHGYL